MARQVLRLLVLLELFGICLCLYEGGNRHFGLSSPSTEPVDNVRFRAGRAPPIIRTLAQTQKTITDGPFGRHNGQPIKPAQNTQTRSQKFSGYNHMRFAAQAAHTLNFDPVSPGVTVASDNDDAVKINGLGTGQLTASTDADGGIILSDVTGNRIRINVNQFSPSPQSPPQSSPPPPASFLGSRTYRASAASNALQPVATEMDDGSYVPILPEHEQVTVGVPKGHLLLDRPTMGPDDLQLEDSEDGLFYDSHKAYDMVEGLSDRMAIDLQTLTYAQKTNILAGHRHITFVDTLAKDCNHPLCPSSVAYTTNA